MKMLLLQSASAQAALQAAQVISNSAGAALVAGAGAALQPANGGTEIQVNHVKYLRLQITGKDKEWLLFTVWIWTYPIAYQLHLHVYIVFVGYFIFFSLYGSA